MWQRDRSDHRNIASRSSPPSLIPRWTSSISFVKTSSTPKTEDPQRRGLGECQGSACHDNNKKYQTTNHLCIQFSKDNQCLGRTTCPRSQEGTLAFPLPIQPSNHMIKTIGTASWRHPLQCPPLPPRSLTHPIPWGGGVEERKWQMKRPNAIDHFIHCPQLEHDRMDRYSKRMLTKHSWNSYPFTSTGRIPGSYFVHPRPSETRSRSVNVERKRCIYNEILLIYYQINFPTYLFTETKTSTRPMLTQTRREHPEWTSPHLGRLLFFASIRERRTRPLSHFQILRDTRRRIERPKTTPRPFLKGHSLSPFLRLFLFKGVKMFADNYFNISCLIKMTP